MNTKYDFSRAKRGAIAPLPNGKSEIIFALDEDVLEWFRAQVHRTHGGDYQALMNEALREYIQTKDNTPDKIVRHVVRSA